jgi:hypothetical protein
MFVLHLKIFLDFRPFTKHLNGPTGIVKKYYLLFLNYKVCMYGSTGIEKIILSRTVFLYT